MDIGEKHFKSFYAPFSPSSATWSPLHLQNIYTMLSYINLLFCSSFVLWTIALRESINFVSDLYHLYCQVISILLQMSRIYPPLYLSIILLCMDTTFSLLFFLLWTYRLFLGLSD